MPHSHHISIYKYGMSALPASVSKEVRGIHLVLPSSFIACLCSSSNESFIKTHTAGQIWWSTGAGTDPEIGNN